MNQSIRVVVVCHQALGPLILIPLEPSDELQTAENAPITLVFERDSRQPC